MLTSRVVLSVIMGIVSAACGAPEDDPGGSTPVPSRATAGNATSQPPPPSAAALATGATAAPNVAPPSLALEEVGTRLREPIGITGTPDGWLLVNEQAGRVVALDPGSGETALVLDLTDRVGSGGERGLLGLALHPGWPDEPRAFVHYTDRDGNTVISELAAAVAPSPPRLDPATERILLREVQPYANHNGGQLAFGPDGLLYIGLGDGGSGGDPEGNGQDPASRLGKILRLDVDAGDPYAIPDDNPYADGGGAPEVFLLGLRNPWRFSFDRETGELWIADVGQNAFEEVNRVDPAVDGGANLGWNVMEGAHCFAVADCARDGLTLPLTEYGHDRGCSITGGAVYRGDAIAGLAGWYLFSDYCSGLLFGVRADAAAPADGSLPPTVLLDTGRNVSAFGEDAAGELYLADVVGGTIYRIAAGD